MPGVPYSLMDQTVFTVTCIYVQKMRTHDYGKNSHLCTYIMSCCCPSPPYNVWQCKLHNVWERNVVHEHVPISMLYIQITISLQDWFLMSNQLIRSWWISLPWDFPNNNQQTHFWLLFIYIDSSDSHVEAVTFFVLTSWKALTNCYNVNLHLPPSLPSLPALPLFPPNSPFNNFASIQMAYRVALPAQSVDDALGPNKMPCTVIECHLATVFCNTGMFTQCTLLYITF